VATGGDTIRYEGSPRRLFINGNRIKEPYLNGSATRSAAITGQSCNGMGLRPTQDGCRVPAGKIFVMGDNRINSSDSRVIGPIDEGDLVGRAFVIIWPLGNLGGV
jgi:signal peptidase I